MSVLVLTSLSLFSAAFAQDFARVVSRTANLQQILVPSAYCAQRLAPLPAPAVAAERSNAGAVVGAIAGGLLGSTIGRGDGRVAAAAIGAATGALIGDRIDNDPATAAVRRALGLGRRTMLLHASNLRAPKRIDLLLETVARIRPKDSFKLVVLAGASFAPWMKLVRRLGLADRVVVRERVTDIEDYLQAADIGLFTSEMESFCVSILEAMNFGCPSVAPAVGGIPEVTVSGKTGLLVPF
ncbi:MAG: glycosyltransferase, partial [Betaproteobacteria bacterium]|nr:glycosyltransferase [Betaproteobacteria bacterium]